MHTKSVPSIVWIVPAVLLCIAVAHLPYGYYTFTRIVTCGIALLLAIFGLRERPVAQVWSVPLLLIAVLFNPFVPIHLNRATWFYLDLGAAATFLAHFAFVRLQLGHLSANQRPQANR